MVFPVVSMPATHMSKAITAGTDESGPQRAISFSSTDLFLSSEGGEASILDLASDTCMQQQRN